ncbi:MAG: hypothetical protein U0694_04770 [Anaerolineae bacterium]
MTPPHPFWQRGFYDNVIRDERMPHQFRVYIDNNPSQWAADRCHP